MNVEFRLGEFSKRTLLCGFIVRFEKTDEGYFIVHMKQKSIALTYSATKVCSKAGHSHDEWWETLPTVGLILHLQRHHRFVNLLDKDDSIIYYL